jgi:hypothetical protein
MTDRSSSGGIANWTGAAFELRLGVEFCVYILIGDAAGLGPGAATRVQLQPPEPVDDLVLEFDTGARWAVQAKAGSSVRVEWNPDRPFGKALRQLYDGTTSGRSCLRVGAPVLSGAGPRPVLTLPQVWNPMALTFCGLLQVRDKPLSSFGSGTFQARVDGGKATHCAWFDAE